MIDTRFKTWIGQDAWESYLREVFQSLDITSGIKADNVSASVAMYCRQYHPHGVLQTDLVLLLARAFCAVNDRASAERVLRSMKSHARHVDRWLEILFELEHFPSLLPYFSLGIIRPADWAGAQLDRMWTLDLGLLVLSDSERHEMMLYRSVRAIIEHMFMFWDATFGAGVLGIKGLTLFDLKAKEGQNPSLTVVENDLFEYIEDLFSRHKKQRQWLAIPTLLNLDL